MNQNQPITDSPATGMITPHTVIEPMRPVTLGPPKLAKVVNHNRPTVPISSGMLPVPSQGKNGVA